MPLLPTLTAERLTNRGVQKPQHKCTHIVYTPPIHTYTPPAPLKISHTATGVSHTRVRLRASVVAYGFPPGPLPLREEGPGSPAEALAAPTEESAPSGPLWTVRAQDPRATSSPPHWKSLSHVGSPTF